MNSTLAITKHYHNPLLAYNRSLLYDPNIQIDAVIFHAPELKYNEAEELQKRRSSLRNLNNGVDPFFIMYILVSNLVKGISTLYGRT